MTDLKCIAEIVFSAVTTISNKTACSELSEDEANQHL